MKVPLIRAGIIGLAALTAISTVTVNVPVGIPGAPQQCADLLANTVIISSYVAVGWRNYCPYWRNKCPNLAH